MKHQEQIFQIFSENENIPKVLSILGKISPLECEDEIFDVKKTFSIIFLILFFRIIVPQSAIPEEEIYKWCNLILMALQNVDPFPNHYKIFIHALAFIAHVYQYDIFPFQDAIIEHICQSIDSNVNMNTIDINSDFNSNDDINIYLAFLQLFVNQKYNDVKAFLNEICFLETKIE